MRLLHELAKTGATFDDPDLVSRAGLVPVMALAQRAGLGGLVAEHVRIGRRCGVNAQVKVACLAAGMIAGADSIDDMDLLRHGAMPALFGGIRAPSTLGSFLRSFTWGNVRQLDAVARLLLAELARRAPLLPGAEVLAFIDMDSTQKRVYGHAKQGAGFGHTKIQGKSLLVRGLNALPPGCVAATRPPPGAPRPSPRERSPPHGPPDAPGPWWRGPTRRSTPRRSPAPCAGPGRSSRSPCGWTRK